MKKAILLIIGVLFTVLAQATDFQPLSYEKFMLMNTEQQNKVLLNMMEIIVELEQNQLTKNSHKNVNYERLNKIQFLFSKIQNLIIAQAHADPATEKLYLEFAQEFNKALSEKGSSDKCIYAGWVSRMKVVPVLENGTKVNKKLCVHPSTLPLLDNLSKSYMRFKDTCKIDEIACQPAIFGFKKGQTPICVPVNTSSNIHNASAACLKEATNPSKGSDSLLVRLEKIKNLIKDHNSASAKEMNAMYLNLSRACVCSEGLKSIDVNYTKYMQPHQTCFGLLSSIKSIRNDCYPPEMKGSEEMKFFESLSEKLIYPKEGVSTAWADYQPTIEKFSNASFCQDPVKVQLNCIPKCKLLEGKINCTFINEKTQSEIKPKEDVKIESGKNITVYDNDGNSVECKIPEIKPEIVIPPSKYECNPECLVSPSDANKRECKFSILKDGKVDEKLKADPQVYNDIALEKGKNEIAVKFEANSKAESVKCLITPEKSDSPEVLPEEKKITCSAKCESKEENKILCTEFSILEDGIAPKNLSLITAKYEGEIPKDNMVSVDYEINDVPGKVKCDFDLKNKEPEEKKEENYDLSLKIDETTATARTLSALINNESKIPDGYTINWSRKDTGALKFDVPKKEEKSSAIPDGNAEVSKDKKVESGIIATGKLKVSEPRKSEDYKVCASLLDKTSKVIKEKCETIPKQPSSTQPTQQGGGRKLPPPPQPINRGNGVGTGYGGMI